jgi:hypothetical protein
MKGGMASLFYVLEKLHQEGRRPKGDIVVQSVVGHDHIAIPLFQSIETVDIAN